MVGGYVDVGKVCGFGLGGSGALVCVAGCHLLCILQACMVVSRWLPVKRRVFHRQLCFIIRAAGNAAAHKSEGQRRR